MNGANARRRLILKARFAKEFKVITGIYFSRGGYNWYIALQISGSSVSFASDYEFLIDRIQTLNDRDRDRIQYKHILAALNGVMSKRITYVMRQWESIYVEYYTRTRNV